MKSDVILQTTFTIHVGISSMLMQNNHVWYAYGKKFTPLLSQDWNITLKTAVKHLGFKRKYKLGKQIEETIKMI